ncbi:MAG: DUF1365 domain-containing protein [Pseudomonadota bacterium]
MTGGAQAESCRSTALRDAPGAPITAYPGAVTHTRLRPVRHRLRYTMTPFLIDLNRLADADRCSRFFAVNRRNLFSFHEADHGAQDRQRPGDATGWLADEIRALASTQLTGQADRFNDHGVHILAYPRVLGYVFNPLTVFYLFDPAGQLTAIVHQVNNTFGERHFYVAAATQRATPLAPLTHSVAKDFYVSPFNARVGSYRFHLTAPADKLALAILHNDTSGPLLHACFTGARAPVTNRFLLRLAVSNPLMTHKAMAGIHWEALKLWWKGVQLVPRPQALTEKISVATTSTRGDHAANAFQTSALSGPAVAAPFKDRSDMTQTAFRAGAWHG